MGGGGPSKPKMQPVPEAAKPLDYTKMFAAARENSRLISQDQIDQLKAAYPEFEKLQLGTIDKVSANLNNESYREAKAGLDAVDPRNNAISRQLNASALADLQLGRALSPEQERAATQAARAGMSARGLGVGNAALAAEVLNRDAYASQREAQRRTFAGAVMADTNQTALNVANQRMNYDPYQRAFAPGASFGQGLSGQVGGMVGQAYTNALGTIGNVETFNTNMIETRRNTALNNNAALQGAYLTSGATNNAGWMSMIGGMAQGGGALGGAAINKYSDRRMKKDIKPIGKGGAGGILGLTTYEFRYKDGDDRKHIGFMAQDVQKVLPEAVEEVDYKGQRRLVIKPKVIGDAIAEILADGQAGLFDKGYTVGSGRK
jgi:hypothetical protein